MDSAACRMRHAVGIVGGPACSMCDKTLEPAIDLAVRVPDCPLYLDEGLREFGLALHCEDAVRHEAQRFEEGIEFLFHFRSRLRWQRIEPLRLRFFIHARPTLRFAATAAVRR